MLRVKRRFGKFLPRTADEAQVSVLLKDFDDVDELLSKIIDASRAWKDGWQSILRTQENLVSEFQGLYVPIIGASEHYNGPDAVETPEEVLERTSQLLEAFRQLKAELMEEINAVDSQMVKPATEAKEYLQPMKKVIKRRESKKLDFERYRGKVDAATKKTKRSERENAALAKLERDLERATEDYEEADSHLKNHLPPVVTAAFSILPPLLTNQILIQNAMLAQYYTAMYTYCNDYGFPSNTVPVEELIQAWEIDFNPIRQHLETEIAIAAPTKPSRLPAIRSASSSKIESRQPRLLAPAPPTNPPKAPPSPRPDPDSNSLRPIRSASSSVVLSRTSTPGSSVYSPAGPNTDYFTRDRQPSQSSISSAAAAAAAAKKKKPPPPPPPKKPGAGAGVVYVTAMYGFGGQADGDLVFSEGDKIKVLKKTESLEDWWEGELNGCRGTFPANYCK